MEGYLTKEADGGTFSRKKRLFAVLKPASSKGVGRLECFEKAEERITPKPVIMLQNCTSCEAVESAKYGGAAFRLVTPERTWIFIAESAEACARWVEAVGEIAFGPTTATPAAAAFTGGPPRLPPAPAPPTERSEDNMVYSSGGIFTCQCTIRRRPELDAIGVGGPHSIVLNYDSISIFDETSRVLKTSLHFVFMRKYSSNESGYVSVEMGRRWQGGEAVFIFDTPKFESFFVALDRIMRQRTIPAPPAAAPIAAVASPRGASGVNELVNIYTPVSPRDRYNHLERPAAYTELPDAPGPGAVAGVAAGAESPRMVREAAQLPPARANHNYDMADETLRTFSVGESSRPHKYQNVDFIQRNAEANASGQSPPGYGAAVLPGPDEPAPRIDPSFYMQAPAQENPYADPPTPVYATPHAKSQGSRQMRMLPGD